MADVKQANEWTLSDGAAHLPELVERAASTPQTITRDGEPVAVLVGIEEWRHSTPGAIQEKARRDAQETNYDPPPDGSLHSLSAHSPQKPDELYEAAYARQRAEIARKGTLADFFMASPLRGSDLDLERTKGEPRDLAF